MEYHLLEILLTACESLLLRSDLKDSTHSKAHYGQGDKLTTRVSVRDRRDPLSLLSLSLFTDETNLDGGKKWMCGGLRGLFTENRPESGKSSRRARAGKGGASRVSSGRRERAAPAIRESATTSGGSVDPAAKVRRYRRLLRRRMNGRGVFAKTRARALATEARRASKRASAGKKLLSSSANAHRMKYRLNSFAKRLVSSGVLLFPSEYIKMDLSLYRRYAKRVSSAPKLCPACADDRTKIYVRRDYRAIN